MSVLTPSFGYARFIEDAVKSVLGQQEIAIEHVVQDGLSHDGTVEILRSYGRPLRWCSAVDEGQSDALNRAFARARGAWIGWLNADEFYLPYALRELRQAGMDHGADVVFGDAVFVDAVGRFIRLLPGHPFSSTVLRRYGCVIESCTALIRREVLPDAPWDTNASMLMDWDLYLRLLREHARFLYVPTPVAAFRLHPERVSVVSAGADTDERSQIRRRWGVNASPPAILFGRLSHIRLKLLSGGYRRERKARGLRGEDVRWFETTKGNGSVARLRSLYA